MKKNTSKIIVLCLLTAALAALPALSQAQSTNQPDAGQTAPAKSKKHNPPFIGKVGAVDAAAGTLTVGKLTLQVTSETKITKDGKPATLADAVTGERVTGVYQKVDGKLNAIQIHLGAKHSKNNPDASDAAGK